MFRTGCGVPHWIGEMTGSTTVLLMRPGVVVALVVGASLVAACGTSSGDDAAGADTASTTPPTAVSSPVTVSNTTSPPPSTTTSTMASTTTVDATQALIAEIEADLNEGEQAFLAAGADPSSLELRAGLRRYFFGRGLERTLAFMDELEADGLVVRPSADTESVIVVQAIEDMPDRETAVVRLCRVDAGVVIDPSVSGGGAIVNDEVVRYDTRIELRLANGKWQSPGDGEPLDQRLGISTCD